MTQNTKSFRLAPGPKETMDIDVNKTTLLNLQNLQKKYGNIVTIKNQNGRSALFINDPSEIHQILVRNYNRYAKGPGFERIEMLLGSGLIVSNGDTWRRARTMIQPSFSRQNIHKLIMQMIKCTKSRAIKWKRAATSKSTLNITQEMGTFALELILLSIFGDDYEDMIVKDGSNPFSFLSEDSVRDLTVVMKMRKLRTFILEIITRRRQSKANNQYDFLSMYVEAKDKNGRTFSDKELIDEIVTLIIAGYETSAGTLNWVWYLISQHPSVETLLLLESEKIIPKIDSINFESINQMKYTQWVIEETLRLYPPVWLFSRKSLKEDTLTEYDIPPDTDIYFSPYILHRTEKFWINPNNFDPSRFANDDKELKKSYYPFSLGPRRCLGEYFSFLEMKIHLGILIKQFTMNSEEQFPDLNLGINLRSKNEIYLQPKLR
tara:strand:+ start:264 stop:1565 length:1302 start_codon:yes stop_codon:yes gene_type:complete